MPKVCEICGKRATAGRSLAHKGLSKRKGGTGVKTSRVTKRFFLPNIQRIRVIINDVRRRIFVCTKCIKAGKIKKAN